MSLQLILYILTGLSLLYLVAIYLTQELYDYYATTQLAAILSVQIYISMKPYSYKMLLDQLLQEHFTSFEAEYAISVCQIDWQEQAKRYLKEYATINSDPRDLLTQARFETQDIEAVIQNLNK